MQLYPASSLPPRGVRVQRHTPCSRAPPSPPAAPSLPPPPPPPSRPLPQPPTRASIALLPARAVRCVMMRARKAPTLSPFMSVQHTAGATIHYYSGIEPPPVIHARRGNAATAAAAGWQWQQPHQRSERPCRDCLSGGVSGGLSTSSLRVAGGRQRQLWSQRSEPTECPCLDSLFGGESGGRAIGSTR